MSLPTQSDLSDHPGLIPWLVARDWIRKFASPASDDDQSIRVESMHFEDSAANRKLGIEARVRSGVNHLSTLVELTPLYNSKSRSILFTLKASCACSSKVPCGHALAVLELLRSIAAGTAVVAARQLDPALTGWLKKIKSADSTAKATKKPATGSNHFIAYCIKPMTQSFLPYETKLHFSIHAGISGRHGVTIDTRSTNADPSRPSKSMVAEDMAICARFNQRNRKLRHWGGSVMIEGAGWEDIIGPALASGRLFYGCEASIQSSSSAYQRLNEGPPLSVEPSWEQLPKGAARPVIVLPSPSVRIIPVEPLFYLDTENSLLGKIESPLAPALLLAWSEGPAVPASDIPALNSELAAIIPENPLPLPMEKPARTLAGIAPSGSLHITNVLVGIFLKRHVGGVVRFHYPGSPPLLPLDPDAVNITSWIEGDTRVVLERDRDAEAALTMELKTHGLTLLHELIPAQDLNDKNRHSVVLQHPTTRVSDWLEFLEGPNCKSLKAKGWNIDADPKLGLTIHDVRDFFPAIESESANGIDWFRFDVTGEFEGKRVSLIPQIARAISEDWHLRYPDPDQIPESLLFPCEKAADGHIRFPARRFLAMLEQVRHLFHGTAPEEPIRLDRLGAAGIADALAIESTETNRALAELGRNLRDIHELPTAEVPATIRAELRPYQLDGFRWLQFLADHGLHGVLADDMGLGKTLQTLAHLAAQRAKSPEHPSLVIAPTSVVPNWAAEAEKFAPGLTILVLHGGDRADNFEQIPHADIVLTSYPLLVRDFDELHRQKWDTLILDEAQYIKNPKSQTAISACSLKAKHRICLSGTPMENHLGELWSLLRFLMPGFLPDEKKFNLTIRKAIERDHSQNAQLALNRRVSPLILRRTKDQVATELPDKTTLIHGIDLTPKQTDLYESVRAAMDERVRKAIEDKGLAKSHIIVLDALLKLRQICCHPQLLKSEAAQRVLDSAKLEYLTQELLPTLLEEGRRILLFSQFTSMLELIEEHLNLEQIPYLKLTGKTKERANLVKQFQSGEVPVFLISLKAGGTGLNLTAADTVIHYDPWWNPAAENQATDRAHRIGQTKPVFVHKLICRGTIEERILDLQKHKSDLVDALLSEETTKLKIDAETLSHLLAPLD